MGKWSRETYIRHAVIRDCLSHIGTIEMYSALYGTKDNLFDYCIGCATETLLDHGYLPILYDDDRKMIQDLVDDKIRDLEEWREFYRFHGFLARR